MARKKRKIERKVKNIYLGESSIFKIEIPEKYKRFQPVINAFVQYLDLVDLDTYERDYSKLVFNYKKFNSRLNVIKLYCLRSALFYPKEPQLDFIEKIRKYADTFYDVVANKEYEVALVIFFKNLARAMVYLNKEFGIDLNYLEKITKRVLNMDLKDAKKFVVALAQKIRKRYM